jgi:hypothetical protein
LSPPNPEPRSKPPSRTDRFAYGRVLNEASIAAGHLRVYRHGEIREAENLPAATELETAAV